jgi:hypothetical protein
MMPYVSSLASPKKKNVVYLPHVIFFIAFVLLPLYFLVSIHSLKPYTTHVFSLRKLLIGLQFLKTEPQVPPMK